MTDIFAAKKKNTLYRGPHSDILNNAVQGLKAFTFDLRQVFL